MLVTYHWPGNVRELENCLERAAVMSETGNIEADLMPAGEVIASFGTFGHATQRAGY